MKIVLFVLLRFVVAVAGYIAACLAASAFLHLLFLGSQGFSGQEIPLVFMASVFFSIPFVALFIAYFALIPSAVIIGAAEILGKRDWLYYAVGGGVVGLIIVAMFWHGSLPAPDQLTPADVGIQVDTAIVDPKFFGLMVGGGIIGGLAYWLVAGQSAQGMRRSKPL